LVSRDQEQLLANTLALHGRLSEAALAQVKRLRWSLAERQAQLRGLSPEARVRGAQQQLDDLSARAALAMQQRLRLARERWRGQSKALVSVSPFAVLERGYSLVTAADGSVVRSTAQAVPGAALTVRVADGEYGVEVRGPQ
jgi:exodeoxyribonuclease VII large subunit